MRFVCVFLPLLLFSASPLLGDEILAGAISGSPYGVATIEIPLEIPIVGQPLPPLEVSSDDGRVFYPVSHDVRSVAARPSEQPVPEPGRGRLLGRLGNLIREIASGDEQLEQTTSRRVMFLFHGEAPLRVHLSDSRRDFGEYDIVPIRDEPQRRRELQQWWSRYSEAAREQIDSAGYPPWVETYLVAMLSGRLNLPLPSWYDLADRSDDELLDTLKLIAGAEEIGARVFRQAAARGENRTQVAALPLPEPPVWAAMRSELLADEPELEQVAVEPIATRVPPECFYIRYGSFTNYLWFRDLADEYGGDISRMVTLRGINDNASQRVERQLNLRTTDLSRVLGPSVIEDEAIIGRDLFLSDGASIGVLLKSTQPYLLRTSLQNDRLLLVREDDSVTLADETIAGRTVSLLSTPDHRIRSFLVEDGEYFFVTNSRTLVERFLEVGQGAPSLASTISFRLARQLMPLSRSDTVFAYFSPAMMQGLMEPQYLIELRRRMYAESDIALVHLARLAAATEGHSLQSADDLAAAGFLPNQFGQRNDGTGTITVGPNVLDSSRGARGTFLPIADAKVAAVTNEEALWYRRIADQSAARFNQLDPIMFGIQRQTVEGVPSIDRLTIHAEVAPWQPEKYGKWSRQLGEPTQVALEFAPDDIVAVQAHVASETLGPPTHLFAAIKDTVPPDPSSLDGFFQTLVAMRSLPGYLGAWPQPGALDRLPLGLGRGQPVGPGMTRLIGGLYRYTGGGFSIVSFQPDVLQASLPFIAAIDVEDAAQVRAHVGNLAGSQLENWVNSQLYARADETSRAGASFLNLLSRQLKVPAEQVPSAAEAILGTQLQCSLGGDYIYREPERRWTSTAYRGELEPEQVPPDYVAPFMVWFRGLDATLTQYSDRLVADLVVDVARNRRPTTTPTP